MGQTSEATSSEISRSLERVLASREFAKSKRSRELLRYLVQEFLEGRSARLKGYAIGVEVFGRDESFNPDTDTIVRVQAGRLRSALEHYYLTEGQNDPVVISLPKGAYVPAFEVRQRAEACAPDPSQTARSPRARRPRPSLVIGATISLLVLAAALVWTTGNRSLSSLAYRLGLLSQETGHFGPTLVLAPIGRLNPKLPLEQVAEGLTQRLVVDLARFRHLTVRLYDQPSGLSGGASEITKIADRMGAHYLMDGTLFRAGKQIRISVRLFEGETGTIVWTEDYEDTIGTERLLDSTAKIAGRIASKVGRPLGVINRRETTRYLDEINGKVKTAAVSPYRCLLMFFEYTHVITRRHHAETRACLEKVVEAHPSYAAAWAALAWIYSEETRFGSRPGDSLTRALTAARRGVQHDPQNAMTHQYLGLVLQQLGLKGNAKETMRRAVSLNAIDPLLLVDTANVLAWNGELNESDHFARKATELDPGRPPRYHLSRSLVAYQRRDDEKALNEALAFSRKGCPLRSILAIAAAGRLGRPAVVAELKAMLERSPGFRENPIAPLRQWHLSESLIEQYVQGLRMAGMMIGQEQASPPS